MKLNFNGCANRVTKTTFIWLLWTLKIKIQQYKDAECGTTYIQPSLWFTNWIAYNCSSWTLQHVC